MGVEIRVEAGWYQPHGNSIAMDANHWTASAIIDGSGHTDAAAPTVDLALYALAQKLAEQVEMYERRASRR